MPIGVGLARVLASVGVGLAGVFVLIGVGLARVLASVGVGLAGVFVLIGVGLARVLALVGIGLAGVFVLIGVGLARVLALVGVGLAGVFVLIGVGLARVLALVGVGLGSVRVLICAGLGAGLKSGNLCVLIEHAHARINRTTSASPMTTHGRIFEFAVMIFNDLEHHSLDDASLVPSHATACEAPQSKSAEARCQAALRRNRLESSSGSSMISHASESRSTDTLPSTSARLNASLLLKTPARTMLLRKASM